MATAIKTDFHITLGRMKTQFSPREQQVIEQLLQGKSNKQIALALGLSVRAVEFHLGNLYAKLGVASRTEAALKLSDLRESTGADLWQSTTSETEQTGENGKNPIHNRSLPMKKLVPLLIISVLTVSALILFMSPSEQPAATPAATFTSTSGHSATETPAAPVVTPPATNASEALLEEIRQLAQEYDQAVQAEKKNGQVEIISEEEFYFQNESLERIYGLYYQLMREKEKLDNLYVQIVRAERQPTPYPTPRQTEQWRSDYDYLVDQVSEFCRELPSSPSDEQALSIYDPLDGKYISVGYGEEHARCMIHIFMTEEWRNAPLLAQIDHEKNIDSIQKLTDNSNLRLQYQTIEPLANAPSFQAAIYVDETGTRYGIEVSTGAFVQIEPNYPTQPAIAESERKSLDELRSAARQFAFTLSPRLAEMESELRYEEGCKGDICFFSWNVRNLEGLDLNKWLMMPPFLQVGLLADGQVATLINTLDLVAP
jgi:DNA-binding CsgD family transcriptional regulator